MSSAVQSCYNAINLAIDSKSEFLFVTLVTNTPPTRICSLEISISEIASKTNIPGERIRESEPYSLWTSSSASSMARSRRSIHLGSWIVCSGAAVPSREELQGIARVLDIQVSLTLVCRVLELVYIEPRHCNSFPRAIFQSKYHYYLEIGNKVGLMSLAVRSGLKSITTI